MATEPAREVSLSSLVTGALDDVRELFRQEMALARQEIRQEMSVARSAAIKLAIGGGAVSMALLFLLTALALGISMLLGWPAWAGFGLVGFLLAALGGAVLAAARRDVREFNPVPQQTVETLKENMVWMRSRNRSVSG